MSNQTPTTYTARRSAVFQAASLFWDAARRAADKLGGEDEKSLAARWEYLQETLATAMPAGKPLNHPATCKCWRCDEMREGPDGLSPFRPRAKDPTTCGHPADDREPISGDGWLCGHCGALVPAPSDVMRNDESLEAALRDPDTAEGAAALLAIGAHTDGRAAEAEVARLREVLESLGREPGVAMWLCGRKRSDGVFCNRPFDHATIVRAHRGWKDGQMVTWEEPERPDDAPLPAYSISTDDFSTAAAALAAALKAQNPSVGGVRLVCPDGSVVSVCFTKAEPPAETTQVLEEATEVPQLTWERGSLVAWLRRIASGDVDITPGVESLLTAMLSELDRQRRGPLTENEARAWESWDALPMLQKGRARMGLRDLIGNGRGESWAGPLLRVVEARMARGEPPFDKARRRSTT